MTERAVRRVDAGAGIARVRLYVHGGVRVRCVEARVRPRRGPGKQELQSGDELPDGANRARTERHER